jgi:hypothetical protein
MADTHDPRPDDDEPVLDVRPVSDVEPLGYVYVVGETHTDEPDEPDEPPVPVGRPVIASSLTATGVVGTVVAAVLPWSGGRGLAGVRALAAGQSWLIWLLLAVAAALLFGVVALVRPGRRVRWWGAATAAAGAALSGWAVVALPAAQPMGVGPALACLALALLTAGQLSAALARNVRPWRWRPAGVAVAVVALVLAGAGFGSAGLVNARNVDATTASGPLPTITGTAPSTVDTRLWGRTARVYDVAGSVALVVGQRQRGSAALAGVSVLDLRTGAERWHHYELGWTVREAALTGDGTTALIVIDTSQDTDAIDFDVATGTVRWRERLAAAINCVAPGTDQITPVGNCAGQLITGDGLLFIDGAGHITYLAARDGRSWPIQLGQGCRVRGAGADSTGVYVLDQCVSTGFPEPHLLGERVIAYDMSGRQRWSRPLDIVRGEVAGGLGPVFVRGDVVFAEQEERYFALAANNGAELWTTTDGFEPETTVTDGDRLAWSTGIQVLMLGLHDGSELWERYWQFPEEADLPVLAAGRLYLIQHTIGPNPYSCAVHATLLTLAPNTGEDDSAAVTLPDGAGNDCGPDVEDRMFLRGPLLVLLTADTITVLTGH